MNPRNSETAIETKHKREIEELILELHQAGSILSLKIQQRFELRNQVLFLLQKHLEFFLIFFSKMVRTNFRIGFKLKSIQPMKSVTLIG